MKSTLTAAVFAVMTLAGLMAPAVEKERVLFFAAHPDDIISSMGTILLMREKFDVHVCDFTCGAPGTKPAYYALRKREEERVCREMGVTVHWYDTERDVRWVEEKPCKRFAEFIAELRPRAVFGHWPVDVHSDHMMSCAVLQKAVQLAKLDCEFYFFEESYDSKNFQPAFYVDITSVAKEKERLIRMYESQNKDDEMARYEMRNSAIRGERLKTFDAATGQWRSTGGYAEAFATYGGRPQGPIIFAELPKVPKSQIAAHPEVTPEPLKAKPKPEPMRFVTFNIWGDYFKNPVEEREDVILRTVLRLKPDVLSMQEVTRNWWKSKLFRDLAADYGIVRGDEDAALVRAGGDLAQRKKNWLNHEPLLYRKDRLTLLDSGMEFFHLSLDASKCVTWGVFEDRRDGRRFISFALHFWYMYKGYESHALRELNARKVLDVVAAAKAKWGDLPVIGGGDLNCNSDGMPALLVFERAGYSDAGKCADAVSTVPSEHDGPNRGADGRYHGEKGVIGRAGNVMLDRVFYTGGIHASHHDVDCTQETLDASDHSPVVVDFSLSGSGGERHP